MKCRVTTWARTAAASVLAICVSWGGSPSHADGPSAVVEGTVEGVRKSPQGYMVAPTAVIPFVARVRDPHGLKRLDYVVTAARQEAPGRFGPEDKEQKVPAMTFVRSRQQRAGEL